MSGRREIPTDPAELRADIEKTRAELGDTVEALVHKADVPARAKAKGHEMTEKAAETAQQAKAKAAEAAAHVGEKAAGTAQQVKAKAATVTAQAVEAIPPQVKVKADEARAKASEAASHVAEAIPPQVKAKAARAVDALPEPVARRTRQHPAVTAGIVAAVLFLLWKLTRGRA
jgi:Fe2+ transport system protein B